jgi:hypothetical protein
MVKKHGEKLKDLVENQGTTPDSTSHGEDLWDCYQPDHPIGSFSYKNPDGTLAPIRFIQYGKPIVIESKTKKDIDKI